MTTKNHKLREAQNAIWDLQGILTQSEILKITGFLQGKKDLG